MQRPSRLRSCDPLSAAARGRASDACEVPLQWLSMLRDPANGEIDEDLECARLEVETEVAEARAAAARRATAEQTEAIRAVLRDDLVASQLRLAELERRARAQIDQIHTEAELEVRRILSEAQTTVEAIRSRVVARAG
jgi:hypothetical protein